jgi:hypothetical protein
MTPDATGGDRRPQPASAANDKPDKNDNPTRAREKKAATEALRTAQKKAALLNTYRELASISAACRVVKIHRDSHYRWMGDDPVYRAEFQKAQEPAVQTLEDEAIRRAVYGVEEPIVHGGQLCYRPQDLYYPPSAWQGRGKTRRLKPGAVLVPKPGVKALSIRRYSDPLLALLLKAHRPDKYKERTERELSSPTGKPIKSEMRIRFIRPPASAK